MAPLDSLPAIDECIETYHTAYATFGERPFSPADLEAHVADESSDVDLESRLRLLVAYGLLDRLEDTRYRLRCFPDERSTRWRDRFAERAETVHRLATDSPPVRHSPADATPPELVHWDDDPFVSVVVSERDDVDDVATTAATGLEQEPSAVGIVLRTSGDLAAHVQGIADALCETDETDRPELPGPFEKAHSDVVGESKNGLEFQLFLRGR